MSTASEFADWKKHPVTARVFAGLREREASVVERLAISAGVDPAEDRYLSGYVSALRDMYQISVEDEGSIE